MTSQITNISTVCSVVCSGAHKNTSKFRVTDLCEGNHWRPVDSPRKGPATREMLPSEAMISFRQSPVPPVMIWNGISPPPGLDSWALLGLDCLDIIDIIRPPLMISQHWFRVFGFVSLGNRPLLENVLTQIYVTEPQRELKALLSTTPTPTTMMVVQR